MPSKPSRFVIEFTGISHAELATIAEREQNPVGEPSHNAGQMTWPPTLDKVRCQWKWAYVEGYPARDARKIGDLPGERVEIDCAKRKCRLFDPLLGSEQLANIQVRWRNTYGSRPQPREPKVYDNLSDTQVKTWCYHAAKLVAEGFCKVVEGNCPTLAEVAELPGKTQVRMAPGMPVRQTREGVPIGDGKWYLEDLKADADRHMQSTPQEVA